VFLVSICQENEICQDELNLVLMNVK